MERIIVWPSAGKQPSFMSGTEHPTVHLDIVLEEREC